MNQRLEDEAEAARRPEVYLAIFGLQRARDLRAEEEFSFSAFGSEEGAAPSLSQQFATILREGPDLGVHTLVWCDTYTNLTRTLDRRSLREFEMRVVFQMNAEDSANLIDAPAEGRLEKFRPYGLPTKEWFEQVKVWLSAKSEAS